MSGPELWHVCRFEGSPRIPRAISLEASIIGSSADDAIARARRTRQIDGRRNHLAIRAGDVVLVKRKRGRFR